MTARICLRAALLVLLAMPQVIAADQGQTQPSQGQPGTPGPGRARGARGPQGPPLQFTLADAKAAGDAAEAAMRANNWRMIVVITDPQGVPVYLSRGDGVGAQFYNFAMGKVRAVVATGLT